MIHRPVHRRDRHLGAARSGAGGSLGGPTPESSSEAPAEPDDRAAHGLGIVAVAGRLVVASALSDDRHDRVWFDLVDSIGAPAHPLGVVSGAATAVPLLYLHRRFRSWAADPLTRWRLVEAAVGRYRHLLPRPALEGPFTARPPIKDARREERP